MQQPISRPFQWVSYKGRAFVFRKVSMAFLLIALSAVSSFAGNRKDSVHSLAYGAIYVSGEVCQPGFVNFAMLPLYTLPVKEVELSSDTTPQFVGAYQYHGYPLRDLLEPFLICKSNEKLFPPVTDLYIEVSNDAGDKARFSWYEVFFPSHAPVVALAIQVTPILPHKTDDLWPIPETAKIIATHDLISCRNITNPSKISIHTTKEIVPAQKGLYPFTQNTLTIFKDGVAVDSMQTVPENLLPVSVHNVFYGQGKGLHSLEPHTGFQVTNVLHDIIPFNKPNLATGLVLFVSEDGYRAVYSYSELANRNDQQLTLLIYNRHDKMSGVFRIYPSFDFFSDRAVKGITSIRFSVNPEQL
jgi:hypothetical protein